MKNRGFSFAIVIFAVAISALVLSIILYYSLRFIKDSKITNERGKSNFDTALDKALSTPAPTPTGAFVLNKDTLVGIWHTTPMMPSGWAGHYNFYPSGKYTYYYSTMDCAKTKISESGYWTFDGLYLDLTVKAETVLLGGKLENSSGSCGTDKTLVGATRKTIVLPTPKIYHMWLTPFTEDIKDEQTIYKGVLFGNSAYWKFEEDPTAPGYYTKIPEFPEPTGF